jgi:hypothetical protein
MPFAATYFYEAGFTVLLSLKSKKGSKLEVEDDIEIKLGRQYTYNVALRCARGTIVAVEIHYVLLILLLFGAESFIFQFAIQKVKDQDI